MPKFGTEAGSLKELKKSLAKGGGGDGFIKFIPKDGTLMVRFLTEPENWVSYNEHYDEGQKKSFPCTNEASCPGCIMGSRKPNRYLANAVLPDEDRVVPLLLPKDLANRLVVRYERLQTLMDRDYELSRSGSKLDTVYDVDPMEKSSRNLTKYTALDLHKVLEAAYAAVFGGDTDEEEEAPVVRTRSRSGAAGKASPAKAKAEPEFDVDDDDDGDDDGEPVWASRASEAAAAAPEVDEDDDTDDASDDTDEADEDADADGYTEDELRAMPLGALRGVARNEFGLTVRGKSQDEIVKAILDSGEDA